MQGGAPALVRPASTAQDAAIRADGPAGHPEGTRPDTRLGYLLSSGAQFVFLGTGEQRYEQALVDLATVRA